MHRYILRFLYAFLAVVVATATIYVPPSAAQSAQSGPSFDDPRVGLEAGWQDAGEAIWNLRHLTHRTRPEPFRNPENPGDFGVINTDIAFQGDYMFLGNYNGLQVWDISDPVNPAYRTSIVCPGGQGDVSVFGDLLFMSVEETRGRIDCGTEGVSRPASPERFRGVRIFDMAEIDRPEQVAAVQTCRGSHTHTLVTDPRDDEHVYVYVSGTSPVRPAEELEGCSGLTPEEDPNTALFQIEVIRVPLAEPAAAEVVSEPRIFADESTGAIDGLWPGGRQHEDAQSTARTDQCHDITVYPELGLAAGACSGNGLLLDISDPVNPTRIHEVSDANFAYWHSATFSNDGDKVLFTDEWGGGVAPRCRATDRPEWGADAIFRLEDRRLEHVGYYKMPAVQTEQENCVAHNGSLIPVPGRDIMVQAWYQGGISIFDFTDPEAPVEIAYFDRGPMDASQLLLSGYWSAYWYNGRIYGSEIGRGLDVFELEPSEYLSENEIEAARLAQTDAFNAQLQTRVDWPASYTVARAYVDQLERSGVTTDAIQQLRATVDEVEASDDEKAASERLATTADALEADARILELYGQEVDARKVRSLAGVLRTLGS